MRLAYDPRYTMYLYAVWGVECDSCGAVGTIHTDEYSVGIVPDMVVFPGWKVCDGTGKLVDFVVAGICPGVAVLESETFCPRCAANIELIGAG